ncbi:MAG TPA: NAD-dependent epimerase/dehydratase family protein, partial [Usitatibacter sp.]
SLTMRVLVIGGTGSFSSRITELAARRGHDVMVVTRGRRALAGELRARMLIAERSELRSHAASIARFDPEAVVDSICFEAARAEDLVALFSSARRVVLVSSVDVYGEDVGGAPVTEERAPRPATAYAQGKLACERVVLDGLGARATVIRPSHILGRAFLTTSLWSRSPYPVDRIRKGKAVPAIDGGRNLMTPVYALDAASWVVESFENPAADGEVFNAVGAEIVTQRDYYACIARILGVELKLVAIPSQVFRRCVDSPSAFNFHRPYSNAKAVARLGQRPAATLRTMMEETVGYMLEHGLAKDCAERPVDDALVELALRHEAELQGLLASKS